MKNLKRVLVLTNEFYPPIKPTSKMVYRVLSFISKTKACEFTVISFALDNKKLAINKTIENIHIFNYSTIEKIGLKNSLLRLFYKIARKIYSFVFPRQFFETGLLYKKAKKVAKQKHFDAILAFSGYFAEHKAAYNVSKKTGIPLFLFYADPFFYNVAFKRFNKKRLIEEERKWIELAKTCFMPHNYLEKYLKEYSFYSDRLCECELAGFFDENELSIIRNAEPCSNLIVYAGSFFYNWRRPDMLIKIACLLNDYRFVVMGNLNYSQFGYKQIPNNIEIIKRLSGHDYLKMIGSARALFLEDNSFPEQIPYKAFEYISTGKTIVYSSINASSSTSRFLSHYENKVLVDQNNIGDCLAGLNKCNLINDNLDIYYYKFKTDIISDIIWERIKEI